MKLKTEYITLDEMKTLLGELSKEKADLIDKINQLVRDKNSIKSSYTIEILTKEIEYLEKKLILLCRQEVKHMQLIHELKIGKNIDKKTALNFIKIT